VSLLHAADSPAGDALPLDALVAALGADGRLVHVERIAGREAILAATAAPLRPDVREALEVEALWSHQAAAIDLARSGRSVAVATGTASGKSLCFRAPIAEAVTDPIRPGTALCVFPTKALARDQLRAFADLDLPGLVPGAYDGDCSPEERQWVRRHANVVVTNPEMLHCALLPHHRRWATFLLRLRYVVVDELHAFRGVFGTHVAHVLRRLRRLAALHGASPTFVGCSATIGDPGALAAGLWGGPVEAVTDDGSPRGERLVALWRPGGDGDGDPDERARSAHAETADLLAEARVGREELAPWLFSDTDGPPNPDRVSWWWKRARKESGIDESWRLHDLRHWSATQAIAAGYDVQTVARRLGHADATTTLRVYSHAIDRSDPALAEDLGKIMKRRKK